MTQTHYQSNHPNYPFLAELSQPSPMMKKLDIYNADIIDGPVVPSSFVDFDSYDDDMLLITTSDRTLEIGYVGLANAGSGSKGTYDFITLQYSDSPNDPPGIIDSTDIVWEKQMFSRLMRSPASSHLMTRDFYLPVVPTYGVYVPIEVDIENFNGMEVSTFSYSCDDSGYPVQFGAFPTNSITLSDVRDSWMEWFFANGDYDGFNTLYHKPELELKMKELNKDHPVIKEMNPTQLAFLGAYYLATEGISFYSLITAPTRADGADMSWQAK